MPHRIGYLYERMISLENCIEAEKRLGKNKPDNKMARHIAAHAERYGRMLHDSFVNGSFRFHENKEKVICESYKGKTRHLKIPCLSDQAAQIAWLNIATPYIERRNYYYNCGSIPGAGQSRSVNALKRWLKDKRMKYGGINDIRHYYETLPHWVVLKGLWRIFKDRRFVEFAERDMANMSGTGIGLAIGHPTSHWYANVALMELDHEMRRRFPDVRYTRYMDNGGFASRNKRHLKWAMCFYNDFIEAHEMKVKRDWQRFPIKARGLTFLSYRFFNGFTLLTKRLMYRIARKMRRAKKHLSLQMAMGVVSYIGILKHCNSYNFKTERVYPFVNQKQCRRLISNASKNNLQRETG